MQVLRSSHRGSKAIFMSLTALPEKEQLYTPFQGEFVDHSFSHSVMQQESLMPAEFP